MNNPIVLLAARRARVPQLHIHYGVAEHAAALEEFVEFMEASLCKPGDILEIDCGAGKTAAEILYKCVAPRSAQEVWTTAKGEKIKIGDMNHEHLVHALALVMRTLRQKGGHWALNQKGALRHYYRCEPAEFNWEETYR